VCRKRNSPKSGTLVTVGLEEIQAALGENDGSVVRAERTPANQPLILQMSDAPTSVADIVAQFVEAALRHNPKRADRPEHATLSAIDLVGVLPLAYGSRWCRCSSISPGGIGRLSTGSSC
jgi:hypothetical protein